MSAGENKEMKKNKIVLFETQDNEIKLEVPVEQETVWLTANSMAELFDRDEKTIRKHINNVFSEEEVDRENNTQKMRVVGVKQHVPFYSQTASKVLDSKEIYEFLKKDTNNRKYEYDFEEQLDFADMLKDFERN